MLTKRSASEYANSDYLCQLPDYPSSPGFLNILIHLLLVGRGVVLVNLVLIVVDTLRADHLGCYGYARPTSPYIDRLAADGGRFSRAYAQNNTTHPSFTTILSGRDPLVHGIVGHFGRAELSPDIPLLAEVLSQAGYRTVAIDNLGRWFQRGFADYRSFTFDHATSEAQRLGQTVTDTAISALHDLAYTTPNQPFFLFAHYWDPHAPYLVPPEHGDLYAPDPAEVAATSDLSPAFQFAPLSNFLRHWMGDAPSLAHVRARYDSMVSYADAQIGRLLDELDALNLRTETLVVLTADHGESLGEHGIYFDHHGLYNPTLHVPLIMRHPQRIVAGTVVDAFARHTDIVPTVLDALSISTPASEGRSLLPLLDDRAAHVCDEVLSYESSWQSKRSIRTDRWRLILSRLPDTYGNPMVELYDCQLDSGETFNVAETFPDVATMLAARLRHTTANLLERAGRASDPQDVEGITLRPIVLSATQNDTASTPDLESGVVDLLVEQGKIRPGGASGELTAEERALVEERLTNLGYM